MAKTAQVVRSKRRQKFTTRQVSRCHLCGRQRAYIRYFGLCRICFRRLALAGELPGVTKANT